MLLTHLILIGLSDEEAIALMYKVAVDSMTAQRAKVLAELVRAPGPITSASIAKSIGTVWKVANRVLEDLEALGLVSRLEEKAPFTKGAVEQKPWVLDHEDAGLISDVLARGKLTVLPELAA
jgi:hypothetical protein